MKRIVSALGLLALLSAPTPGQSIPALINYQGRLTDAQGDPLPTADYVLTFTVHDAEAVGTQVWGPQIHDGAPATGHGLKVPVVQGWFNIMLGPVDTSGRSLTNAFDASDRWVQIQVNDKPITPRQRVVSAPFALRAQFAQEAQNAQTLANRAAADFVSKQGDTMTGNLILPTNGLSVGTSQLVITRGRVGIGTTEPEAQLHVSAKTGEVSTYLGSGDDANGRLKLRYDITEKTGGITSWSLGSYMPLQIDAITLLLNTDSLGKVGIGTKTPQATLDVAGTVSILGARIGRLANAVHQAETDGFVVVLLRGTSGWGSVTGYAGSSSPPSVIRGRASYDFARTGANESSFTMPVRKSEYYRVEAPASGVSVSIEWVPMGR